MEICKGGEWNGIPRALGGIMQFGNSEGKGEGVKYGSRQ